MDTDTDAGTAPVTKLTVVQRAAAKDQLPPFILKRVVTLFQCTEHQMAFPKKGDMLKHLDELHTDNAA